MRLETIPDYLSYVPIPRSGNEDPIYAPVGHSALVPNYIRLDQLTPDAAREALLASSALPLGVVPSRRGVHGLRLIDGGVADNVPWFPLIQEFPCDELIIIHCNAADPWKTETALKIWNRTERLPRVLSLKLRPKNTRDPVRVWETPPVSVPFHDPEHWPISVTLIAPEASLGNFVSGTMNFSARSTRKWMEQGYSAGLQYLAAESCLQSEGGSTAN
jgi:hypothetical protein